METHQSLWWYNLLHDLRQSTNESSLHVKLTQAFADHENAGATWNYENILIAILTSNDLLLRLNLLSFFQEHAKVLLTGGSSDWSAGGGKGYDRIAKVYGSLTGIVSAQDANDFLRGQVLVSLTTIFIDASVITEQTNLIEALVSNLLDVIDNSNKNVAHRLLRQTACMCLRELELSAPGLLVTQVPRLFQLAQAEYTHAVSGYILLLTASVQHAVVRVIQDLVPESALFAQVGDGGVQARTDASVVSGGSGSREDKVSAVAGDGSEVTFFVPPLSQLQRIDWSALPQQWGPLSRNTARDVMRCVSLAVENTTLMTPHVLLQVVKDLLPFSGTAGHPGWCNMPANTFRDHFFPFIFTNDLLLCHTVLMLQSVLPAQFTTPDHNASLHRLVMLLNGSRVPLPHKLLAGQWLSAGACDGADLSEVHSHYDQLYPSVFDPLSLKESKLRVLFEFLSSPGAPQIPTHRYLEILVCVNDFRYSTPTSPLTRVYFEALYLMATTFPFLTDLIHDILARLVIQSPKFHPCVVGLISKITASSPDSLLPVRLMKSLNDELCALEPVQLERHFPLVEGVMRQEQVNPCQLLRLLLQYLQSYDPARGREVHLDGDWEAGNDILRICRTAIMYHPTPRIFSDMTNLLRFMSLYYNDLEIRDRSQFYLSLISHVSGLALAKIIAGPQLHESVGGIARMVTPKVIKDRGPLRATVPEFLNIQRCTRDLADGRHELSLVTNYDEGVDTVPLPAPTTTPPTSADLAASPVDSPIRTAAQQGTDSTPVFHERIEQYRADLSTRRDSTVTLFYTARYIPAAESEKIAESTTARLLARSPNLKSPGQPQPKGTPPYATVSLSQAPFPDKVYGLTLSFSTNEPYSPLSSVTLPYLEQAKADTDPATTHDFPYEYVIGVRVAPMAPVPATIDVMMYFNDSDGKTCRGDVPGLEVGFQDLLSVPEEADAGDDREEWFSLLWEAVVIPGFLEDPSLRGTETVRVVPFDSDTASDIIAKEFSDYFVGIDESDGTKTYLIQASLPPKQHLLMRIVVQQDGLIVITARTDDSRILMHLDTFYDAIFPASESGQFHTKGSNK